MFIIKVGTITNAQRAVKLLKLKGIKGSVHRQSNPDKKNGCGYVVKVRSNDINAVADYLRGSGIKINGVEEYALS